MQSEAPSLTCADIADDLAADSPVLAPSAGTHVETCLRCQAEVASYRRMRRLLRSMASHPAIARPELEREIIDAIDTEGGRSPRVPAAAAATIGGLAAAAGVIAFAARHRRVLRLAG